MSHPVPPTRVLACLSIHSVAPFARFSAFRNLAVPQTRFLALSQLYTVLTSVYKNSIQKTRKNCIQHESARKCVMMSRYDDDSGRMGPAHTFESYANISSKLPPRTQRPLSNQTTRQMSRAEYLVPYRNALRPQIIRPTSTLGGRIPQRESPGFEVWNPYEVPRLRHSGRTLGQLSASASPDPGLTCCLAPTA